MNTHSVLLLKHAVNSNSRTVTGKLSMKITPAAPASTAFRIFAVSSHSPRRTSAIFPLTAAAFVSASHARVGSAFTAGVSGSA